MVCSTDRSKAVVPVLVLLFVALWVILRGNLLYVFPCVILFLCLSVLLVLRLPSLGKRELILVLFVRLFGLCLFRFIGFLFLLRSGKGCGLWLWHSLDFSLTFFALRKQAYSNILKILSPKNEKFQIIISDFFLNISAQNIDCGYSLKPPKQGGSNEYHNIHFLCINKKNNVYPCKPECWCKKVRFKGVKVI